MIDLRSDTLTKPTEGMRQAMYTAEVGDDVYGEDLLINELQSRVADMLGKEAALFVPSGTMSNQLAIRSQTVPGDELICEADAHIFHYEGGGPAMLSGVQLHPLRGDHGILTKEEIEPALRPKDHHFAQTRLIAIENTHNRGGGIVYPLSIIQAIGEFARENGISMHMDGARLMNAVIASGLDPAAYAAEFDSVSLCLSKGLGAPIGSVLSGSAEIIDRAHRYRKMLGGGMRQVGILGAAGHYALDNHVERLAEDHHRAKELAKVAYDLGFLDGDLAWTQTNIVVLRFANGDSLEYEHRFREAGLSCSTVTDHQIRMVTHLDFDDSQLEKTKEILKKVLG